MRCSARRWGLARGTCGGAAVQLVAARAGRRSPRGCRRARRGPRPRCGRAPRGRGPARRGDALRRRRPAARSRRPGARARRGRRSPAARAPRRRPPRLLLAGGAQLVARARRARRSSSARRRSRWPSGAGVAEHQREEHEVVEQRVLRLGASWLASGDGRDARAPATAARARSTLAMQAEREGTRSPSPRSGRCVLADDRAAGERVGHQRRTEYGDDERPADAAGLRRARARRAPPRPTPGSGAASSTLARRPASEPRVRARGPGGWAASDAK